MAPLVDGNGGLVSESIGKADLLLDLFDSKRCRVSVDLPFACDLTPTLFTFAFRSSVVKHLWLDFDPYSGIDPLGMFPFFLKRTADVLTPTPHPPPPPIVLVLCFVGFFIG